METNTIISDSGLIYDLLMQRSKRSDNDHLLASMLASWITGDSGLPQRLGLSRDNLDEMLTGHFDCDTRTLALPDSNNLDAERRDEFNEVYNLLMQNRAGRSRSEDWIAQIISAGCQASDHLWQDLGLWSRNDLSHMMMHNFPALAQKNDKNMKWKKFIYKQLCITEGIYTCRAPSCEVCADYDNCFGPEE